MLKSCTNCVREHIGKAHGYFLESLTGRYPARFWLGIGQLAMAWEESVERYPELAKAIDEEKKKMILDDTYWADTESLIVLATDIAKLEKQESEKQEIKNGRKSNNKKS